MSAKPRKMIRVFQDAWQNLQNEKNELSTQLYLTKNNLSILEDENKVLKMEVADLKRRSNNYLSVINDLRDSLDDEEKEVWVKSWVAIASAINTMESKIATTWADKCLADYRERFPAPTSNDNS